MKLVGSNILKTKIYRLRIWKIDRITMNTQIYWLVSSNILYCIVVLSCAGGDGNTKQTVLESKKAGDLFFRRSKRYLVFEKGASVTVTFLIFHKNNTLTIMLL